MPPSTRSNRVSAPPDRVYESVSPLVQVQFPAKRQRVYGRTSLGAPLNKKRQNTLTQIGFVNPEKIDDEIEEYEREEKRRKLEAPKTKLKAKPALGEGRETAIFGARLRHVMDNKAEQGGNSAELQKEDPQDVPVERLDDTPEPSVNGEPPKRRRKSRRGIKIGVKIVTIKIESPEVLRHTQRTQQDEQHETQGEEVEMVMDSFQAAPSFEEEGNFESHLRIDAEQEEEAERRRNRVIPDSDAESEDDEIVYDSNDERHTVDGGVADLQEHLDDDKTFHAPKAGSDVDRNAIEDSNRDQADTEQVLDELEDAAAEEPGDRDLDLTREIPDSDAESEDEEYPDCEVVHDSQHGGTREKTLILNSFSLPSTGDPAVQPRLRSRCGPSIIPDSFSVPASPIAELEPVLIADSFYKATTAAVQPPAIAEPGILMLSTVEEEEIDFIPSSSAVLIPDIPQDLPEILKDISPDLAFMLPPKTPTKPRRTEIPNTNSTCSPLSTQSTLRSITPNSTRSKMYNRSPSKSHNRSPLKRLTENNILPPNLSRARFSQSLTQPSTRSALRESQISTQGTPTQHSRLSHLYSFGKPDPETQGLAEVDEEDEPAFIPDSPTIVRIVTPKPTSKDSQYTTDSNSPSRQIHSELSAASRPSIVGAETQMRSQWLGSDGVSSGQGGGETQDALGGESQWLGDLIPESLMLDNLDQMSVPPILDDDSVWDEFGPKSSIQG